jgi:hypothetical protein
MSEPTKAELLAARQYDTEQLRFPGLRGDPARHLSHAALIAQLDALPPAPTDVGTVDLLVARGVDGSRHCPAEAMLTVEGGMPGDRWVSEDKYGPIYQLATIRTDVARVIANGQPLELHGDNLFLSLDISADNLPEGTTLILGDARVVVTPKKHNGCKKWVQRFGLAPMQLNLAPSHRARRLRGLYLRVIEAGVVKVGDPVRVLARPA